jgi:superfamily II DNA/RNA helicase
VQVPVATTPASVETTEIEQLDTVRRQEDAAKLALLRRVHAALKPRVTLVFMNDAREDRILQLKANMKKHGLNRCEWLINSSTKDERFHAVRKAQLGKIQYLFCSDMASRGLDLKGITHVINLDCPRDYVTYLHRAGRVGRIGGYVHSKVLTMTTPETRDIFTEQAAILGIEVDLVAPSHGEMTPVAATAVEPDVSD